MRSDYCITEAGGFPLPLASTGSPKLPVTVAEKGVYWCTVRVRGRPGHGSRPFRGDNALVKAAEIVRRLAEYRPRTRVPDVWRRFVEGMELPADAAASLLDPSRIEDTCASHPDPGWARLVHASTHTSIAPTVLRSGIKTNVIPDRAELQVDIRTLPGQGEDEVRTMLAEALGDLHDAVEVVVDAHDPATASPLETPLWETLRRATAGLVPGAGMVPFLATGSSDARFFRSLGATSYGFGLFSNRISYDDYSPSRARASRSGCWACSGCACSGRAWYSSAGAGRALRQRFAAKAPVAGVGGNATDLFHRVGSSGAFPALSWCCDCSPTTVSAPRSAATVRGAATSPWIPRVLPVRPGRFVVAKFIRSSYGRDPAVSPGSQYGEMRRHRPGDRQSAPKDARAACFGENWRRLR